MTQNIRHVADALRIAGKRIEAFADLISSNQSVISEMRNRSKRAVDALKEIDINAMPDLKDRQLLAYAVDTLSPNQETPWLQRIRITKMDAVRAIQKAWGLR